MAKNTKNTTYLKIAYLGGGSRGWAHTLMNDLALCPDLTGEVALYDIDVPMAQLNARWGQRVNESPKAVSQWKYRVAKTLPAALKGADFVFCSIQPGPIQMMGSDLNLPAKYGILHTVGDTVGPAGMVRSLRAATDYAVFARAIRDHAPKAWVINFTNPMTVCTRTLYKVFPEVKAFGCCHEVFGSQYMLARLAKEYLGLELKRDDVHVTVMGVNHFTWITEAHYRNIDLLKLYERKMNEKGEVHVVSEEEAAKAGMWSNCRQVGYDLYKRFGALATAGERHIVEFVPFYLKDEKTLHRWGVNLTPYSYREERYMQAPKDFRRILKEGKPIELWQSDEEAIRQMKALLGMGELRTNVNLPNVGQVQGLPKDAVVETNAYFTSNSVKPEFSGRLPAGVEALVLRTALNQEMIVEAAIKKDKKLAFQAFLNDPLMTLTTDKAGQLFDEMLQATRKCLPGWDI
jgi:galacturan 1,4-alpha-galacturonidase